MVKRYVLLTLLLTVFIACGGRETPQQLWDNAKDLTEQEKYEEAMDLYQRVLALENTPDSLRAKTIFTMADLHLNHFKRTSKALQTYQTVTEQYGTTNWGAKAQFMIGYVYANHVNNYEKAKSEYQRFLEIYPTHELADAVRFEMKYMGKDLDEVDDLGFMQQTMESE
ncbi:MAG: tetratricopeptide repeat protein [Candidatus Marinimicrobia bacterium]|nr:tetratricopeptide repeat protein [Candidatus Neomarinimicrobiota bacterium]MCF7828965.1 tetratricopeptide repeat protein [Candidatus Neomarinimicrobiota bacterium]MCF7879925.1 tetratricopeptide repeat protein [Candidatus Neomarinimicrobiota bacterium]